MYKALAPAHPPAARPGRRRSAVAVLAAAGLAAGLLTACQPPAATFTVTTTTDAVDATIGDGICATSSGECSLRAAVQEGNTNPDVGPIEVVLPAGTVALTIVGGGEDGAATGDLDLTRPFLVRGAGATSGTTIDDQTGERAFDAFAGANLEIQSARLTEAGTATVAGNGGLVRATGANVTLLFARLDGGEVTGGGGLVFVDGSLVATDSVLEAGRAGAGGGVLADQVLLTRVSLTSSVAANGAALALVDPAAGASTMDSSIVTSSSASAGAVVATVGAPLTIRDSSFATNTSTTGVLSGGAATSVGNSVISTSSGGSAPDCAAPVVSLGGNIEFGTGCGFTTATDRQGVATLIPITFTENGITSIRFDHPLVVDAGTGCLEVGRTGVARPTDGNSDGVATCDRGAQESTLSPRTYRVNRSFDLPDLEPGDGLCAVAGGGCTLRAAVQETNAVPTADTIEIDDDVVAIVLTALGSGEDAGGTGDLDVLDDVVIRTRQVGATLDPVTIDANGQDRIFDVHAGSVSIERLVLTDGRATVGGAVQTAAGTTLSIVETTIEGSSATNAGGAIRAAGTLSILRSLVHGNDDRFGGGGLLAIGGSSVSIDDSTFTANSSGGGAAVKASAGATVAVRSSTIVGNLGGPGVENLGTTSLRNSVLANNGTGNCAGTITSLGHNHDSQTTCGLAATGDVSGTTPLIGALADNGGFSLTMKPAAASPVINSGSCTSSSDQRNSIRPVGPACDKGAVEG